MPRACPSPQPLRTVRARSAAALAVAFGWAIVALPARAQERIAVEPSADATPDGTVVHIVAPGASVRDLIAAGRLQDALAAVEARLAVNPSDDELKVQRARLLYWLGRLGAARIEVEEVLGRHPSDLEVLELAAQVRLASGETAKALEYYMALQTAGDTRPEVHQRIVDLHLEIEDLDGLQIALARGGRLSDDQVLARTRIAHPWSIDGGGGVTLYNGQVWPRADVGVGRRLSRRWTVAGGVAAEQRGTGAAAKVALSPRAELWFTEAPFGGMIHLSGSADRAFLPKIDARFDAAVAFSSHAGLGLYLRYAVYAPARATAVGSLTVAPNLPIRAGRFTIAPGWVAVVNDPGETAHAAMLKVRWQATAATGAFCWLYYGDDPNFVDRQTARPARGVTAVVGGDTWLTPRFGLRASAARIEPTGPFNPFTELSIGLRGRL